MTITTTFGRADGSFTTKTEVEIIDAQTCRFSRLIDSHLYFILLSKDAPITMKQVDKIIKLDDELFKILSGNWNHQFKKFKFLRKDSYLPIEKS